MFYVLTLSSIRYVKEVILPLRNFCLCLLLWQELTLFPAFTCHNPGNVTKCFSEVHFFPYSQLLFPTKIAASGKGILARADTKGELQSSASFPNHLEPHCKCHISRDSYHRGAAAAVQTPKNPHPQDFMLEFCLDFLLLFFLRRGHT